MARKLVLCLLLVLPLAFAGWAALAQPHHHRHCHERCGRHEQRCFEGCR